MKKTKELGIKVTGALVAALLAVSSAQFACANRQLLKTYAVECTVK